MIKAVTFDYWNTLFADDDDEAGRTAERFAYLARVLEGLGEPRPDAEVRAALAAADKRFHRIWREEHFTLGAAEILQVAFDSLGVDAPAAVLAGAATYFQDLALRLPPKMVAGVPEALAQMAGTYKLAIISDTGYTPARVLRELLARHDLLRHFTVTYFSDEGGVSKPNARAFVHVLAELDAAPGEAVHVGDAQCTDIAGAQAVGMQAVLFTGLNDKDAPTSTANAVISAFDKLPDVVSNLAAGSR
jgi:putative hydrolase of the HAD superfamily